MLLAFGPLHHAWQGSDTQQVFCTDVSCALGQHAMLVISLGAGAGCQVQIPALLLPSWVTAGHWLHSQEALL